MLCSLLVLVVGLSNNAWALRIQNCYIASTRGLYYRGYVNVTKEGLPCQNWLVSSPHSHPETPQLYPNAGLDDHDYCRNPGSDSGKIKPWCYTTSTRTEWDYCDIPKCPKNTTCYSAIDKGVGYRGKVDKGGSSKDCVNWKDKKSIYDKLYDESPYNGMYGLADHEYCRNPDPERFNRPWCQIKKGKSRVINVTCNTIPLCDDLPAVTQTCGGNGGGKHCVFPFTYGGKVFVECSQYNFTQGRTPFPWCAVQVDQQNVLSQWAYCSCPSSLVPTTHAGTFTPHSSLSVKADGQGSSSQTGVYVGSTLFVIVVCAVVAVVLFMVWRRRSRKRHLPLSKSTQRLAIETENPTFTANIDRAVASHYDFDGPEHEPSEAGIYTDPFLTSSSSLTSPVAAGYLEPCDKENTLSNECPVSAGGYLVPVKENAYEQPFSKVTYDRVFDYWEPGRTEPEIYAQFDSRKFIVITRNALSVNNHLGSGQFGIVQKAVWHTASCGDLAVAVKSLNSKKKEDRVRFLREAAINGQFSHKNVVAFHGLVFDVEPLMIVLELLENGDLHGYLKNVKSELLTSGCSLDLSKRLLRSAREIAAGMEYLSNKRFVHRDLAARNVLLDKAMSCKIADFGLARDVSDGNYYHMSQGGKIPIKWTAPEALLFQKYSSASDVWSYGIVLYELWSLGEKPYGMRGNSKIISLLERGERLPPPPGTPRAIYLLMIQCWHPDYHKRPGFGNIVAYLRGSSASILVNEPQEEPIQGEVGDLLEQSQQMYNDLQESYQCSGDP